MYAWMLMGTVGQIMLRELCGQGRSAPTGNRDDVRAQVEQIVERTVA